MRFSKMKQRYSAVFNAANGTDLPATFMTHTEDPTHLRFAAFSCDKIKASNHDSHLANLLAAHKERPIDVFLHLGDQVYADDAYKDALKVVKKIGLRKARLEEEDNLVELYRKRYRETWNNKITRELLASGSHLMIWDDHELVPPLSFQLLTFTRSFSCNTSFVVKISLDCNVDDDKLFFFFFFFSHAEGKRLGNPVY